MAPVSTALTTRVESGSSYQLDADQVQRAASSLVKHLATEAESKNAKSTRQDLLADAGNTSEDNADDDEVPVWLILTTKQHVVDQKKLKPGKIPLPYSLNTSPTARICLITADPQRTYKDIIADPSFPTSLSSRIARVIGISKLKAKYKPYENRRQLLAEYDIFLADDRVITYLPQVLGKVFYKGGQKRPVPVSLVGKPDRVDGKTVKPVKGSGLIVKGGEKVARAVITPSDMAKEIEKSLSTALVHLSPSTTTAVKVGKASWTPDKLVANIEAVTNGLTEKFVSKGWRNVRGIHIKGPNSMALPIWLADELWVEEKDVLDKIPEPVKKERKPKKGSLTAEAAVLAIEGTKDGKKRKSLGDAEDLDKPAKKSKKAESDDLAKEVALRKEKLKKQKADALADVEALSKMSEKVPASIGDKVKKTKKPKVAPVA
ncbi:proteasome-interacting protein cic1 [Cryomyces antarcticus]|uniref:Proteasome-interacting protein cic1 n=1 Tax=Cryomyces antarcticus TaxID=329879 RepID=A0ABR0KT11_9PEZI|nr:proteasome-interacting protein cic1 [Cryomyces antarcticus]